MNLRRPVQSLAFATVLHAAGASAAPLELVRLADGVYVHSGRQELATAANGGDIANIGFIVGSRCVAVIDSGGSEAIGEQLRTAISRTTRLPVCYVINTHVHPDHVFGNAAFASTHTEFVGHAHLPAAMAARSDSYLRGLARDLGEAGASSQLIPPTLLVDGERSLDLGHRPLRLKAWRTAHTDGDLTVIDEKTGTLWLGDLLFVQRIPVVDGSVLGWLIALKELRSFNPKHIVPGHGRLDPPWPAALDSEAQYLDALTREVRAALKDDRTLAQAIDTVGQGERSHWLLFDDYHRRNVTTCYTELEWEEH